MPDYNVFFPAALAAATSLALTAGLLRLSFFLDALDVAIVPLTLAHLAFAAALIAALPATLNRPFLFFPASEAIAPVRLI